MGQLLPYRPDIDPPLSEPRLIEIDDQEAGDAIDALTSTRSRLVLDRLYEAPATMSDLATDLDVSLQGVDYHLQKLLDADLIEVVDHWYSEKGAQMKVYAPSNEPLVIMVGNERHLRATEQVVDDGPPSTPVRSSSD